MNKNILIGGIVGLVIILAIGYYFLPKSSEVQKDIDMTNIQNLAKDAISSASLQIEDIKMGTGSAVKNGDTITVNYLGTLTNGAKFDSSYDRNTPFTTQIGMGNVIEGWDKGIVGMKVGGKRKLTIPPNLGYGSSVAGDIPPNSTLIFEVELLAIK